MLRLLVQSKVWVSLGAAALCAETYAMCGEWLRFTMIAHVFFLTWTAYLFIDDEPLLWRKKLAPIALTGALVTFQGFNQVLWPLACGALVLLYRTHWMGDRERKVTRELRQLPLINNLVITLCWIMLCNVWPLVSMDIFPLHYAVFIAANALWIFALSMGEDFFHDQPTPDVTLQFLGERAHRIIAVLCVIASAGLHAAIQTPAIGVWLSLLATTAMLVTMPYGKRTVLRSWLLDAVLLLRVWR